MSLILETTHLILRTWEDRDLAPLTKISQDPKVMEHFPALATSEETKELIDKCKQQQDELDFSLYAVDLKNLGESADCIGFIGLLVPSFEAHFTPAVEIGWRLSADHWGMGYATEGATAVANYAFNTLGLEELVSFTSVGNLPSRRVMEKIGMTHNEEDDFDHPKLAKDHPLYRHVLYRLKPST